MWNQSCGCGGCGCNGGNRSGNGGCCLWNNLVNALDNLFSPIGCGCNGGNNNNCGCGCNSGNGGADLSAYTACGCGYDDYYARQYALYPYNAANTNGVCSCC